MGSGYSKVETVGEERVAEEISKAVELAEVKISLFDCAVQRMYSLPLGHQRLSAFIGAITNYWQGSKMMLIVFRGGGARRNFPEKCELCGTCITSQFSKNSDFLPVVAGNVFVCYKCLEVIQFYIQPFPNA